MVFIKIKYGVSKSTLFLLKLKVWVGLIRVWKHLCFIPKSTFLWSKTIPCYSRCLLAPLMWKQRSAIIVFIRLKINILCFSLVINFCFSHSLFICLSFSKNVLSFGAEGNMIKPMSYFLDNSTQKWWKHTLV